LLFKVVFSTECIHLLDEDTDVYNIRENRTMVMRKLLSYLRRKSPGRSDLELQFLYLSGLLILLFYHSSSPNLQFSSTECANETLRQNE